MISVDTLNIGECFKYGRELWMVVDHANMTVCIVSTHAKGQAQMHAEQLVESISQLEFLRVERDTALYSSIKASEL